MLRKFKLDEGTNVQYIYEVVFCYDKNLRPMKCQRQRNECLSNLGVVYPPNRNTLRKPRQNQYQRNNGKNNQQQNYRINQQNNQYYQQQNSQHNQPSNQYGQNYPQTGQNYQNYQYNSNYGYYG